MRGWGTVLYFQRMKWVCFIMEVFFLRCPERVVCSSRTQFLCGRAYEGEIYLGTFGKNTFFRLISRFSLEADAWFYRVRGGLPGCLRDIDLSP